MKTDDVELIFKQYVTKSSYFKMYANYKIDYQKEDLININELDVWVDTYRRTNKLENLVASLILAARYQIKKNNYPLATIYLIECYEILKRINTTSDVQIYILAELGMLQRNNGAYEEALYYFGKMAHCIGLKLDKQFMSYTLKQIIELVILSRSTDFIEQCFQRVKEDRVILEKESQIILEVEQLYTSKKYEKLLNYIDKFHQSLVHRSDRLDVIMKQRSCCALAKLGHQDQIEWLSKKEEESLRALSNYLYNFEYQFIKNQKTLNFAKLEKTLEESQKYYTLDLFYVLMADVQKNKEYELNQLKNENNLLVKQQTLKVKLQNMHINYKEYYMNTLKYDIELNESYVTKHTFIKRYEQQTSNDVVLFAISLNRYIVKDISQSVINKILKQLSTMSHHVITLSIFDNLIWCQFETDKNMLNTKRQLSETAKKLYINIKVPFQVSVCLPAHVTRHFDTDEKFIHEVFSIKESETSITTNFDLDYYNPKISTLGPILKVNQIITEAIKVSDFYFEQQQIYFHGSQYGTRFRLNTLCDLEELLIAKQCMSLKSLLMVELDFKLIELMAKEIINHQIGGKLFVKLSRETLQYRFLMTRLLKCFSSYNIKRHHIVFEVHEEVLFEGNSIIDAHIEELTESGFNIALDEYGTGVQTGSLTNIKINYLNLSSTLVETLEYTAKASNLLDKVQDLCTEKGIHMCYGQVNSEKTHHFISDLGINILSGTYYH